MGQNEIYDYLLNLRKKGDEKYYSVKEIAFEMREISTKRAVFEGVKSLWKCKYLEHDSEQNIMDFLNHRKVVYRYRAVWQK